MSGWYSMDRGWMDHPLFKGEVFTKAQAWEWLISTAAFTDIDKMTPGGMIKLNRGQVAVSERQLAEKWGWSVKKVRVFIAKIVGLEMVRKRAQSGARCGTILTICNYNTYQRGQKQKGAKKAQLGRSKGADNNNDNNDNNKNIYVPDGFPDRDNQQKALNYWTNKNKAVDLQEQIILFRVHHDEKETSPKSWDATWKTWYVKSGSYCRQAGKPTGSICKVNGEVTEINATLTHEDKQRLSWTRVFEDVNKNGAMPKWNTKSINECPADIRQKIDAALTGQQGKLM